MSRLQARFISFSVYVSLLLFSCAAFATELATLTGYVTDPSGLRISQSRIQATNIETNVSYSGETNDIGLYRISELPTGEYRLIVQKTGFKTVVKATIELHVQDVVALNFQLELGSVAESVTVEAGTPLINTESASVSTVVDRNFAERLPLNGRSFQSLIYLTPGVVPTTSNVSDGGQFSVNGQRADANYWMVDGASANIGIGGAKSKPANGFSGALGSFSVLGGTNSLVSVDAMQEFRIQTSTYAPEFGRSPGAQISIVTRSGTNRAHATLFEYLRNDALDANDWFANNKRLPKPREQQNDFGGTFSGPILKDRTFFFFSYEGLRLHLPQVSLTTVPDLNARQAAVPAMQPYLNAFPVPNGSGNAAAGTAQFNASYSNPGTLDAYSLRVDHRIANSVNLFARYGYSPSETVQRGTAGSALNGLETNTITSHTGTLGSTWMISPLISNDFRFNYSYVSSSDSSRLDSFGGAAPSIPLPFPSPYTAQNATFNLTILSLANGHLFAGKSVDSVQRQLNIVNGTSLQQGSHVIKAGLDYRRLSPTYDPAGYSQSPNFSTVLSAEAGKTTQTQLTASLPVPALFRNLGVYVQDTWHVMPRFTLTYGLRWDVDFAPSTTSGPSFPAATNFDNLPQLGVAPAGTSAFNTPYTNIAPRLGVAYQVSDNPNLESVVRGGFGVFYDMATQETGNLLLGSFPFGSSASLGSSNFPLDNASTAAPQITPGGVFTAFYPNLQLPYTLEWNVAIEQGLGRTQSISATYIGAAGRRLIQTARIFAPNPSISQAFLVSNNGSSDYDALQLQFQRRLAGGLEALASYTWSHSIDTASAGSSFVTTNAFIPSGAAISNRGPSDFDIRDALSLALTYQIPSKKFGTFANAVVGGWALSNVVQARTSAPVDIDTAFSQLFGARADVRPDLVSGQPAYLFGPQFPGGKAFNAAAFRNPPVDSKNVPLRQGNVPRNFLRGFGAAQWDLTLHKEFLVYERAKVEFRTELFNVLNHPNFGPPLGRLGVGGFGISNLMLNQSLNGGNLGGNLGGGAFNPLYQMGGPRSLQVGLKLQF